jgi:hypothetical protein
VLGRLADDLWGSVDGIVPAGSAGNVIGWQIGLVGIAGPASWYRCSGDPEPARV